jgi:hypothetical protein
MLYLNLSPEPAALKKGEEDEVNRELECFRIGFTRESIHAGFRRAS